MWHFSYFLSFHQNHPKITSEFWDVLKIVCFKKKEEKITESKNTHKPHKTMISKAGPGSAMPDGKTGAGFLQNHLQSVPHRQLRKIRGFPGYPEAPIPGKLCYSFSRKPLPCSVPDSSSLLGFRDTGEAAAANCPSATLNLKETPKKPLAKESLGKKKIPVILLQLTLKNTTIHKVSTSKHDCHSTNWAIKNIFTINTSVRLHNLF